MPTKKNRLMLTLDPADEEAKAKAYAALPGMSQAQVNLAAFRLGLERLRGNPGLAAVVGPGGALPAGPRPRRPRV